MRRQGRGGKISELQAVVYSLCALLVISFVLFEVLDIDGSSFSARFGSQTGWAEPSDGGSDIRRALSDGTMHVQPSVPPPLAAPDDQLGRSHLRLPSTPHLLWIPNKHTLRHVLPRASISESPDAA